ncbi:hypothetical protein SERLA73DRAFT_173618 [Serpula lacrymans var. lacrymans S7.3]|uniref:Carotenoid oxygenase n=2 Tax=Serpula lacrymans var. lacrymans TaxID=341189 RepID=F8PEX2_SERL3|nr:uncharacterized protein SERLADRAFT_454411 [Serpula lacrymans var. lacrymans S7.9]EGO04183.1 hypothetical protein SERLA73DRAFT_173618 [Serpula lacrymans var. lacrymans S7.3]EGO30127.1 hypothetical protein SERLADRAFT_454411 [Serpula lacrymans var. lacrymans S7.9]
MSTTKVLEPYNNWPNDAGFEPGHEERSPVELQVTGTIPSYVSGTLYRTGPGGYQVKTDVGTTYSVDHWFDGFTQNHRFQIISSPGSPPRVLYNSRFAVDSLIETIRKTGKLDDFNFGQKRDPCISFFRKVMSMFVPDNSPKAIAHANIGVTLSANPPGLKDITGSAKKSKSDGHASGIQTLWTKTDAAVYRQIDPETLEPIGFADQKSLHHELVGHMSAAHAKSDPVTGDIFNYNLDVGRAHTYRVFRVSADTGETEILATITDARGAYLHSMMITENYIVLCIWSAHYAWGGAKILWDKNMLDAIGTFDPSKKALWYVIDRRHGKGVVSKYETDPFFCFHTINAWEEPSPSNPSQTDIVATLCAYENLDVLKRFYYSNIKSTSPDSLEYMGERGDITRPNLRRWRLPSIGSSEGSRAAVSEHIAPKAHSCDLPSINPRFIAKPSRYVYGASDRGNSTFFDGLVKYDMQSKNPTYWHVQGQNPGEPVFIANPVGVDEDDGVLLSVVLDGHKTKSYLLVLDARTMEEVGRASMETVVGFGFHGTHFPQTAAGTPSVDT